MLFVLVLAGLIGAGVTGNATAAFVLMGAAVGTLIFHTELFARGGDQ